MIRAPYRTMDSEDSLVAYSPLATAWWHYANGSDVGLEWVEEYRPIVGLGVTSVWRDHELTVCIVESGGVGEVRQLWLVGYARRLLRANASVRAIFSDTVYILSDGHLALGTFNSYGGVRVGMTCWYCSNSGFSEAEHETGSSGSWNWVWHHFRSMTEDGRIWLGIAHMTEMTTIGVRRGVYAICITSGGLARLGRGREARLEEAHWTRQPMLHCIRDIMMTRAGNQGKSSGWRI
jgi:hypothetical protein